MARMTLVALMVVLCALEAVVCLDRIDREKRQVTYHREEHHESDDDEDDHSIQPVTKKPLPTQVVYPGDLSGFYTTETPQESNGTDHRQRRSIFSRSRSDVERGNGQTRGAQKSLKSKDMSSQESRLHSSYHKPSVSIMNDVPVEMSFDGAGFLRHEDEDSSNEQKDADFSKQRKSRGRPAKPNQENKNNRALDDFRRVFNLTRDRMPDQVKFDDEAGYHQEHPAQYAKVPSPQENNQEKVAEYGNQAAENSGTPFAVDFMTAYQNAYQNQFQNPFQAGAAAQFNYMPSQTTTAQSSPAYDPFTFNFPNIFNGQQTGASPGMNPMQGFNAMQAMNPMSGMGGMQNVNQMPGMNQGPTQVRDTGMPQETFMQNHRMAAMANPASMNMQAMFQNMPQQTYNPNQAFQQNTSPQSPGKSQRRKRSIQKNSDVVPAASEAKENHYRRSSSDQQDAGSGFIPITGSFNGGSLQLNFPFYGQAPVSQPSYSTRPVPSVPMYSMPIHPEGRQYGGMEGYYHPSEARRFSYGVLGSGNFEVIRGGLFPGERQQSFNGYQDGRVAYGGNNNNYENQGGSYGNHGGNDYGNFGTTEIIIDGPIQGFQGFDNFPVNLINALSKHSEISVRSNNRDIDLHSV